MGKADHLGRFPAEEESLKAINELQVKFPCDKIIRESDGSLRFES